MGAFCRKTGYSREHATRELSKLRRDGDLAFETKMRTKGGRGVKKWGVIVADPAKLLYDKHSLFYDRRSKPLHNYTTLGSGGEKIAPTIMIVPRKRPRGRPRKVQAQALVASRKQQAGQDDLKTSPLPKTAPAKPAGNNRSVTMLLLGRIPTEYSSQINTARGAMLRSGAVGRKTRRGENPFRNCEKSHLRCWSGSPGAIGTTAKSLLPAGPRSILRWHHSPRGTGPNASSRAMPMRSTSVTALPSIRLRAPAKSRSSTSHQRWRRRGSYWPATA